MGKDDTGLCTLAEIAEVTREPIGKLEGYAARGWFDSVVVDGVRRYLKGDGIWRCGLINHLRRHFGFGDDEIDGAIRYADGVDIARMGGGKQALRLQPFERELAEAGPVWICAAQGAVAPGVAVRFAVHGRVDPSDRAFSVVRDDSVCVFAGEVEPFDLLGTTYARGCVPGGLAAGTYRIYYGGCASYPFRVSADARSSFIAHVLGYFRGTRCGEATAFHPACHLDDGIRSDTGAYVPLVGGWHDAGDFCHITSTTTAGYYLARALASVSGDAPVRAALYDEAMHGADFALRARDAATGKVFENKGVGRGFSPDGWFGDNHRLTDNVVQSGDERAITTEGRVETAMDNLACLAVMSRLYEGRGRFPESCREAAERIWACHRDQPSRGLHHPAKRACAALEWHATTGDAAWLERAEEHLATVVAAVDADGDLRDLDGRVFFGTHYQHGAPFLALALAAASGTRLAGTARGAAVRAAARMLDLARLQPQGVTCYAVTRDEDIPTFTNQGTVNSWHALGGGKSYRMFEPFTAKFWQGSASSLSLLGVGLATLADATGEERFRDLAARHFDWCVGANPYQCCLVSAWGACEAAPLSSVVGYMPGGTIQGPIGDQDDVPYFQAGRGMRVGEEPRFNFTGPSYSREYWSPLSGALAWLRALLP